MHKYVKIRSKTTEMEIVVSLTVVDCSTLENPINGVVTFANTTFGSVATYSCNRGFVLDGNKTRVCQEDGLWSYEAPECFSCKD